MSKWTWHDWYGVPENKQRYHKYKKWYEQRIMDLLFLKKGNKCEECGSTKDLELHEPNGNTDKHSKGRLTKMLDGLIPYKLLCYGCHSLTPNFKRHRRTGTK